MLAALQNFKDFPGAVDHAALKLIFDGKSDGQEVEVGVRDTTGYFYRGILQKESTSQVAFEVLCHDGEFIPEVIANRIVAVRIRDKK